MSVQVGTSTRGSEKKFPGEKKKVDNPAKM